MKKIPKVVYEDDDILVLNKPAGMSVHGDGKTEEDTLADWVVENYPKMKKVGEHIKIEGSKKVILRPGIVHRLDKDTSGVMILAKKEPMFKYLKRQFHDRKINKMYSVLVAGIFKESSGMIDKPIGRSGKDFRARMTGSSARGEMRDAITYYKIVEKFEDYSFIEARPKTGRTHQIRVHMKSIGRPIACDKLYGGGDKCPEGLDRVALHASSIELKMPGGIPKKFEAPLPKDFQKALANLRSL